MKLKLSKRKVSAAAFAAALLSTTVMSGCSSGSASDDAHVIKLVVSEGNSLPFIAAEAGNGLGVWKDKGITVEIVDASSSTVGPTMASREADISLQAGNKAVADIVAGLEATLAAGCVLPWDQYLVAAPASHAEKAADLKDGKFGISGFGSAGHFATLSVAKSLGWGKADYQVVQMGGLENLVAGLKNKTIDAFIWSIDPVMTAEQAGYGKNLGSVAELVGPNAFEAFSVRDAVAKERPEDVKAFFEGYYEAVKQLQADPQKAIDVMVNDWKQDRAIAEKTVPLLLPILSTDGKIPDENLQGLSDAVHLTVENAKDFDVSKVYTYWQDLG